MNNNSKKAILFCTKPITFVRRDAKMLEQYYDHVEIKVIDTNNKKLLFFTLLQTLFFSVFQLRAYSLVASWFVGYHSYFPFLLAKIYRIKTVAFLGGTECHNIPELNHGNFRKNPYAWFTRRSLRLAEFIFPVHDTLIRSEINYVDLKYKKQGFLEFTSNVNGRIEPLYCGFTMQKEYSFADKIPNSFLSVSSSLSGGVAKRKGIDFFIEIAERNPQYQFTLVGGNYQGPTLKNLTIISAIPYDELINIYCKHQYYIQFSIAEGFPNALAEAMIYGCIPLGSSVFGIPDIIDNTGFILERKDLELAQRLIDKVSELGQEEKKELSNLASKRVKTEYTPARRSEKFKEITEI